MRRPVCACGTLAILAFLTFGAPALAAQAADPALGRWDVTLGGGQPCWLEITKNDGQYAGRFLYIYASVFDLKKITVDGNKVGFAAKGTRGEGPGDVFTGTIEGDTITGTTVGEKGNKGKWTAKRSVPSVNVSGTWMVEASEKTVLRLRQQPDQVTGTLAHGRTRATKIADGKLEGYALQFTAGDKKCVTTVKGDVLEGTLADAKFTAKRERQWAEPIELFNGKDLEGWKPLGDVKNFRWKVEDGVLHCDGQSSNIVTDRKFEDCKLHVEFKVPEGGNSGVYLRGRYKIQVADSFGQKTDSHNCGGLYSRIAPSENACKPASEWQTYDITLIGHYLTVVQNGKTIIDNQDVQGITGGAIDSKESEPGPIYLQGDNTGIDYRKVTLTPAKPLPAPSVARVRTARKRAR